MPPGTREGVLVAASRSGLASSDVGAYEIGMRLPARFRQFKTRVDVERAIDEALWLFSPYPDMVREAYPIVAASDGSFVVFIAHGVSYRAVTRRAGRLLSEESAEVMVRSSLAMAFRDRNAVFAGRAADL
jgi:hypothetical protein